MNRKGSFVVPGLSLALALLLLGTASAQLPPLPPGPGDAIATVASPGIPMQMKVSTMGLHIDNMDASPVKGNPFCGTSPVNTPRLLPMGIEFTRRRIPPFAATVRDASVVKQKSICSVLLRKRIFRRL